MQEEPLSLACILLPPEVYCHHFLMKSTQLKIKRIEKATTIFKRDRTTVVSWYVSFFNQTMKSRVILRCSQ